MRQLLRQVHATLAAVALLTATPALGQGTTSLGGRAPGALFTVKDTSDQPLVDIIFLGNVARPGSYRIPDGTNLLDAIAYAGGLDRGASGVLRITSGGKTRKVDFESLPGAPPSPIQAGDVIFAEESWTVDTQVYLSIASVIVSLATMGIVVTSL
jgi:hypothetical protein